MNRRRAVLLPLDEVREVAGEMAEQMDEAAQTIDWYRQVMAEAEVQKPKYGEAARMLEPIFAEANEKVFQTQRYIIQQTRKGAEHSETSAAYKAAFQFLLEHAVPEIAAMAEEIVKTMTKVYHVAPSYSVTKRDAPAKTEGIVGSVVDILKRLFSGLAEKLSPHVDKLGDTLAEFKRMLKEPAPEDARVTVGDMAAFLTEVRRQEHPVNRRKLQEIDNDEQRDYDEEQYAAHLLDQEDEEEEVDPRPLVQSVSKYISSSSGALKSGDYKDIVFETDPAALMEDYTALEGDDLWDKVRELGYRDELDEFLANTKDTAAAYARDKEEDQTADDLMDFLGDRDIGSADNTYNWSWWGPTIHFLFLEAKGSYRDSYNPGLLFMRMHHGGDVRGNYGYAKAFWLDSYAEEAPWYDLSLSVEITTDRGTISLTAENTVASFWIVEEDETETWEGGGGTYVRTADLWSALIWDEVRDLWESRRRNLCEQEDTEPGYPLGRVASEDEGRFFGTRVRVDQGRPYTPWEGTIHQVLNGGSLFSIHPDHITDDPHATFNVSGEDVKQVLELVDNGPRKVKDSSVLQSRPTPTPKAPGSYTPVGELLGQYKDRGLTARQAWDEYVKDVILFKRVKTDDIDMKDVVKFYREARERLTPERAKEIAQKIADQCKALGWTCGVGGNRILRISKTFKPNDTNAYVAADGEWYSILSLLPTTSPGSTWGTDGSSVGGYTALQTGRFVMNKSGGSGLVLKALRSILGESVSWHHTGPTQDFGDADTCPSCGYVRGAKDPSPLGDAVEGQDHFATQCPKCRAKYTVVDVPLTWPAGYEESRAYNIKCASCGKDLVSDENKPRLCPACIKAGKKLVAGEARRRFQRRTLREGGVGPLSGDVSDAIAGIAVPAYRKGQTDKQILALVKADDFVMGEVGELGLKDGELLYYIRDILNISNATRKESRRRREVLEHKGNLARATVKYSDKMGPLVWEDGTTGVMLELGPPRTSGNPRAAWEAGVRHQGWAKDSAYFDTREEATQWLDSYDLNSVASSSYGPGKKFARGLARGLARKESVRKANESVENVVVEVPTVKLVSKLVGRYVPRDFSLWTDDAVSFQHADGVGEIDGLAALERLLDELTGTPTGLEEYSINGSSTSLTFDPDVVAEYQQASGYWAMDADAEYAASELEADPDLAVSLLRSWCREAGVHLDIDDFLTPNEEVDSEEDGEVEEARKRPKRSR